jgi:hypothetical protein
MDLNIRPETLKLVLERIGKTLAAIDSDSSVTLKWLSN